MIFYDTDAPGPNPVTVRLFVLERGGLDLDVSIVSLAALENRGKAYRRDVNPRGEVPALRLDDGTVITEITAICEYLDEMAVGGTSLIGATAQERAITRMWTRRADFEIAQPLVAWWRGGADAEGFYQGHRILGPDAQDYHRRLAEDGLARFDAELVGKPFLAGDRLSLADILLYAFYATMGATAPWASADTRPHFAAWLQRMGQRPSAAEMFDTLHSRDGGQN
jgi:glutathione S-transferase